MFREICTAMHYQLLVGTFLYEFKNNKSAMASEENIWEYLPKYDYIVQQQLTKRHITEVQEIVVKPGLTLLASG